MLTNLRSVGVCLGCVWGAIIGDRSGVNKGHITPCPLNALSTSQF